MHLLRFGRGIVALSAFTVAIGCSSEPLVPATGGTTLSQATPAFLVAPTTVNFENPPYTLGTINGQDDWISLGAAGSGCGFLYDHAVASNTYGYTTFGAQSLRISNAVTSGCFDGTFSKRTFDFAGDAGSSIATWSAGGTRQTHFEAQWDFASTVPGAEQVGLSTVASLDRGDGSRMTWVQMTDTPGGLEVNFTDVQGATNPANFVETNVVTGLSRTVPHTIKVTVDFVDGPGNDVVNVYVDGVLKHTGTSWENYYRFDTQDAVYTSVPAVNRVLFRTGGDAAPATAGKGFLIDNLSTSASTPVAPTTKQQCMDGGWQTFTAPRTFKNQGDCVSFVANGK